MPPGFGAGIGVEGAALALLATDRIISTAHAWSTTGMVLGSSLLAEERRARPGKFIVAPLAIVALSLGLGLLVALGPRFPANGQFTPALWGFALYVSLFWVGHFWHFGQQDFGVLSLYRARAGQTATDRRIDRLLTAAMMFAIQPIVYLHFVRTTAFSELIHGLVPISFAASQGLARAAVAAAILLCVASGARELLKAPRSLPKLLYLAVMLSHPTLLLASVELGRTDLGALYVITYLWSHWMIAIGLTGRIGVGHLAQSGGGGRGLALTLYVAVLVAVTGAVLIAIGDFELYRLFNTDGFRYKTILTEIAPAQQPVVGLVLAFFLGEQLLHYYCDRCLFRLRDPGVRARVAPHLLGEPSSGAR